MSCNIPGDAERPSQRVQLATGQYFGESSFLDDKTHRLYSVTSVQKSTCLLLQKKTFVRLFGPALVVVMRNEAVHREYVRVRVL